MTGLFPDADVCALLHHRLTRTWNGSDGDTGTVPGECSPLLTHIRSNHWHNHRIWQMEDQAHRVDCDDSTIAALKRCIDGENQLRNDDIERIDDELLRLLAAGSVRVRENAEAHSETPGIMIDRMSVLSLRLYHMAAQAQRADTSDQHRAECRWKHEVLCGQADHLTQCLAALLRRLAAGEARLICLPRFTMYNDPTLNPALSRNTAGAVTPRDRRSLRRGHQGHQELEPRRGE